LKDVERIESGYKKFREQPGGTAFTRKRRRSGASKYTIFQHKIQVLPSLLVDIVLIIFE
jgi:hypothetical protein